MCLLSEAMLTSGWLRPFYAAPKELRLALWFYLLLGYSFYGAKKRLVNLTYRCILRRRIISVKQRITHNLLSSVGATPSLALRESKKVSTYKR